MTKRIFWAIVLSALAAVVLASALITLTLYNAYGERMEEDLRAEAGYILHALTREADDAEYFEDFVSGHRVTLIAGDGTVLYDSVTNAQDLQNHADRPEVAAALDTGSGESQRYSGTLSEKTFYYAVKTQAGNVLRVSDTRSSILGLLWRMVGLFAVIVLGVALLSLIIARQIAKRIVTPINALNLDLPLENDAYDELSPLLLRMDRQKKEIAEQMEKLSQKKTELTAITDNMREGLILLNAAGTVLSMNGSAARIFGVKAPARIGNDMLLVTRNASVREAVLAAQRGESADAILQAGGKHYQVLANPVWRNQSLVGVVLLLTDVTEKHTAEMSRREFTANVSHELKTPLTSISGYAEIMRDGVARPEDMKSFAGKIYDEAMRLVALVNDILELSRLDEKKGLGEKADVALYPLAADVLKRLNPLAEEKQIALSIEGGGTTVFGYRLLLEEMAFNLVENAIKYTNPGGSVRVAVAEEGGRAVFSVSDTGVGIPKEHQQHVFERFYRVDKSHSKATGGTGLGLAIVKHGAEIHDAKIELDSEQDKGTRIRLIFSAAER